MVDDVLSLVILAVLSELSRTSSEQEEDEQVQESQATAERVWVIIKPIVISLAAMLVGVLLLVLVPCLYRLTVGWRQPWRETAILSGLLLLTLGASLGAGYAGTTHLLGAFIAGVAFSNVPHAIELWEQQQVLTEWLASIFFATIGFTIPVSDLFDPTALGYGVLYTVPVRWLGGLSRSCAVTF